MGTYSFLLEFDADAQDVYVVRGTLRAYRGTDNAMTAFVRTEQGPIDLSGVTTLEAVVMDGNGPWWCWDYGLPTELGQPILTVPAYSPTPGRVMFTLERGSIRSRLYGASHTLFIRADGRTIYSALLEVT